MTGLNLDTELKKLISQIVRDCRGDHSVNEFIDHLKKKWGNTFGAWHTLIHRVESGMRIPTSFTFFKFILHDLNIDVPGSQKEQKRFLKGCFKEIVDDILSKTYKNNQKMLKIDLGTKINEIFPGRTPKFWARKLVYYASLPYNASPYVHDFLKVIYTHFTIQPSDPMNFSKNPVGKFLMKKIIEMDSSLISKRSAEDIVHANKKSKVKRVLYLTLKKKYFDKILSGEKKTEYREMKDYWNKRFYDAQGNTKRYDIIHFSNGYHKNAPSMEVEWLGIKANLRKDRYGLKLGKILKTENCKTTSD